MLLSPCGWDAAGVILNRSTRTISFTRNGVHLGLAVSAGEICKELDLDKINLMIWVEGIEELVYNFGTDPSLPFASPMDDIYCDEEELHCKGKACMGYGARGWGGGVGVVDKHHVLMMSHHLQGRVTARCCVCVCACQQESSGCG
jgi:hypothetical protein